MKGLLLTTLASFLGLVLVGSAAPQVGAQPSRTVSWERFDVGIELVPDGTLRITETQRIRFDGSFQRGFREIPLERLSSITEVQVGEPGRAYRSGYNQPDTFAVTRSEDRLRIDWWFPPTANTTRTFEIRYRVSGAIRVYEDGDQLYWVAVPSELAGSVMASAVLVRLPQDVPPDQLKTAAYVGRLDRPPLSVSGNELRFAAEDLPPNQDYQVRVQFPHGLVAASPPAWQQAYDRQAWYDSAVRPILNLLLLLAALLLLLGGLLAIFLRWYVRGRDPAAGRQPREVDSPPSNLPAGLAGTLVDERADLQDVLATLLELGNRGVIRIAEVRDPTLQGSDLDYRLELLQDQPLGLRGYERTVIGSLFGSEKEVRLSQIKGRWMSSLPLFQSQLYTEAVQQGLFAENPEAVRATWRKMALAALVGSFIFGAFAVSVFGGAAELIWLPFLALGLVGVAALAAGSRMPRRTKAGVVEAARWRAFASYLAARKELPERANPEEITRYLPYAVALGVDRSWLENFGAIGSPATRWHGGNGPIIIVGPGGWGFPGYYGQGGPVGGGWTTDGDQKAAAGRGGLDAGSRGMSGGLGAASGSLADLLNSASEALSSGGGGWSGGGGSFGGGGSGGGSGGFD